MKLPRPEIVLPYLNWAIEAMSATFTRRAGTPVTCMLPCPSMTDFVDGGLQLLGRDVEQRLARLDGRGDHRVADAMGRSARERAHVVRAPIRVGGVDDDGLERDAQRLGRDLPDHGAQALPEVRGRERDDEVPLVVAWTSACDGSPPRFMPVG